MGGGTLRDELVNLIQAADVEDIRAALETRFAISTRPVANGEIKLSMRLPAPRKVPGRDAAPRRSRRRDPSEEDPFGLLAKRASRRGGVDIYG